ncbi:MAG TPA: helix-turn-helix domain-containing protein [Arachnia sp.]|nr:helix-turn-helix domain-containing protein [Arachnia sp.]HMT86045.1 helix-turn-helix domain-containing protein [Arachnia sp.]
MTELLTRDVEQLHRALAEGGDEVRVTVSRETAEWLAQLVEARAGGADIVLAKAQREVTPTQAGRLLGMSRPQVRKLMEEGKLVFRKIGTHHRITIESIDAFRDAERARRAPLLAELARLQNEAGLVD